MVQFILKRIGYGLLVLFGVVVIVFLLFNVLPGDPARLTLGQRADVLSLQVVTKELGLDKPLHIQLLMYFNDLSPLSAHEDTPENQEKYGYAPLFKVSDSSVWVLKAPYLRRSYQNKKPVLEILTEALPGTIILAFASMLFASVLGIILGVLAAIRQHSFLDNCAVFLSVTGISLPSFFSAILISWLFGYVLSEYTGLNMTGSLYEIDPIEGRVLDLKNLILPTITLGIRPLAIIVQLTRSTMLDVLTQDYIRTATAKGVPYRTVLFRHALRNALNPVVTAISGWFAALLAGTFFVEYIFNWKGIGLETVRALENSDFPVVMGSVLVLAAGFVIMNLLVDILYGILDPRISIK